MKLIPEQQHEMMLPLTSGSATLVQKVFKVFPLKLRVMFSVPTCAKGFPSFTAISSLSRRTTADPQLFLSACVSLSE